LDTVEPNAEKLVEYQFVVPNTKDTPLGTPASELKEKPET